MKTINIIIIVLFIIIVVLLLINIEKDNNVLSSENNTKFLVFGHTYPDIPSLIENQKGLIKENPDFIVFLGDNVAYGSPKKEQKSLEDFKPFMKLNKKIPIYYIAGNHDVIDKSNETNFKKYFSEDLYYSINLNGNTFIFLNTNDGMRRNSIGNNQSNFIVNSLKNDNNKIIFMHNCFFKSPGYCNVRANIIGWKENFVPLFRENGVIGVFNGDVGGNEYYFSLKEDNLSYFGVGFKDKEHEKYYLRVEINGDDMKVIPVNLETGEESEDINKNEVRGEV